MRVPTSPGKNKTVASASAKRGRKAFFSSPHTWEFDGRDLSSSRGQFWALAAKSAGYNLKRLARDFQVNVRQIERYLQRELGRTPEDWLSEQRIIAARQMLIESRSVKRVAAELKIKHIPLFCRQFKRHYGMTPSEFLRFQRNLNLKKSLWVN